MHWCFTSSSKNEQRELTVAITHTNECIRTGNAEWDYLLIIYNSWPLANYCCLLFVVSSHPFAEQTAKKNVEGRMDQKTIGEKMKDLQRYKAS